MCGIQYRDVSTPSQRMLEELTLLFATRMGDEQGCAESYTVQRGRGAMQAGKVGGVRYLGRCRQRDRRKKSEDQLKLKKQLKNRGMESNPAAGFLQFWLKLRKCC